MIPKKRPRPRRKVRVAVGVAVGCLLAISPEGQRLVGHLVEAALKCY
jgi:LPS O-antigen subunit length determinant protein (WzzB/FepE family)